MKNDSCKKTKQDDNLELLLLFGRFHNTESNQSGQILIITKSGFKYHLYKHSH